MRSKRKPRPKLRVLSKRGRIALDHIDLYRGEGLVKEIARARATSYDQANDLLRAWARTAPGPGRGYHKTDIAVHWRDGDYWEGTYTLTASDTTKTNIIQNWMRNLFATVAGLWKPAGMSQEHYEYIQEHHTPEERARTAMILDKYEL